MSQVTHITVKLNNATVIQGVNTAHVITKIALGIPGPAAIVRQATPPLDTSLLWVDTTL